MDVVGLAVERIVGFGRRAERVLEDPGQARQGRPRRAEVEIAVAALEAHLLLAGDAEPGERCASGRGVDVVEAVGEALGMTAAADRFAVGVEDHQLDAGEALARQLAADRQPQALDGIGRGDLAERAAGVGVAGLDAEPAVVCT